MADKKFMTRLPAFAGAFYPAKSTELSLMLDSFLNVSFDEDVSNQKALCLIVPHAGYIYSGSIAGYAYKSIQGKPYKTVILIGPSHRASFQGFALDDSKTWKTPLGEVELDIEFIENLKKQDPFFGYAPQIFDQEHCLEVQIPFLQKTLKNFVIVPILLGQISDKSSQRLAHAIYAVTKDRDDVLVVISSDLSHYYSYDIACALDKKAIAGIEQSDAYNFLKNIKEQSYEACGAGPISVMLYLAQCYGNTEIKLLKYANSGDTAGDKDRVVGYAAMRMNDQSLLNGEEKKQALFAVRETIKNYLTNNRSLKKMNFNSKVFEEKYGAFVTLHKKENLRGCIGAIKGYKPLGEILQEMAISSAFHDPRFSPLSLNELNEIDIEISILSPLKKVKSADEIILGKHGVIVRKGQRDGVFLPQVAKETGWSKEEFLNHLCEGKAGLPKDAWKDKDTELYIFTAQVFGEKC